ncbi:MAG: hypothetical protein JWP96_342 [Polaromonas sp.]|nr:hypothetical protein [Polaromonas sp.]
MTTLHSLRQVRGTLLLAAALPLLSLSGCAVVAVVDTVASVAVGTVGLAASAVIGTARIAGSAVGATADAVLPGPSE